MSPTSPYPPGGFAGLSIRDDGAPTERTAPEASMEGRRPSGSNGSRGASHAGSASSLQRPMSVVRASSSQASLGGLAGQAPSAGSAAMASTLSAGAEAAAAAGSSSSPQRSNEASRANDDRIKSRAVDPSRWNWEAERARIENAAAAASGAAPGQAAASRQGSISAVDAGTATAVAAVNAAVEQPISGLARPAYPARSSSFSAPNDGEASSDAAVTYTRPTPPRIDTSSPKPASTMRKHSSPTSYGGGAPSSNNSGPRSSVAQFSNEAAQIGAAPPSPSMSQRQQARRPPRDAANATPKDRNSGIAGAKRDQTCDACGKPMTGQFVRALGVVYHLDCFRCRDCNRVVAAKFFPATDEIGTNSPGGTTNDAQLERRPSPTAGKAFPLCEVDYFRRLDLICANCSGALRGSYITALGKKFHVEHFTCSICPTVFGPQDSYYEHDGRVFCHFHYSTRFAIRCTGCRTAILKQFVEINRNNEDEHWHPECYMIHKFWNIKLCPTGSAPAAEENETPSSLKHKQKLMEEQVYRIWTVLSAFEESSAACISDMLRHVSSGRYLGGVRMAERFILHVEILFSAIDDLEKEARREQAKGISHIREARMLCKKIVNFFSLLSHTQETGAQRMGITQELLSLVTGLAHYLKILIRIALTGALKLDREYDNRTAISWFLSQLAFLAREGGGGGSGSTAGGSDDGKSPASPVTASTHENGHDGHFYGYRSLPRSTSTSAGEGGEGATDLCVACSQTVEEECVRMGINMRWHTSCLRCTNCRRPTQREAGSSRSKVPEPEPAADLPPAMPAAQFLLESTRRSTIEAQAAGANGSRSGQASMVHRPFCSECRPASARSGFESVTRLEQYAFLLRVALNRLYALLKKRGVVPPSPPASQHAELPPETAAEQAHDLYKDSEIKRVKSVSLDRKLSTKARVPHISTVVGSPSGQQTHAGSVQRASPTEMNAQQDIRRSPRVPRSPSPGQWSGERDAAGQQGRASPHKQSSTGTGSREPSPQRGPMASSGSGAGMGSTRPPPQPSHHAPTIPAQQQQLQSQQQLQQPHPPGSIVPIRPAFARHNTDIRIRDDGPMRQPSGDEIKSHSLDAVTLADIPQLLEAEQAREQHRPLPSEGGRNLSELSALELFIVKHMAVMMLQQSALKDMVNLDDLVDFIEMRKNTFWGKLFKGGKEKKKLEKKGVFGIPLEILVERSGADSTLGATATQLRVPSFVDDIVSAMRQMDMSIEGIFRKNGNIRRLATTAEELDRDSSSVNLSDDNPVQLAALLKKFLRELPDPLLTFKLHRMFVMSQKLEPESERRRILHMVTVLLPKAHRDTMEVLFVFLKWVASFSHIDEETGSKMDLQNLATVLGPNILYSKGTDPAKDETFLANRAVLNLLEFQDDYWTVPVELEAVLQDRELLNSSAELTSRDILKRCEKHVKRARANTGSSQGRTGPLPSGGRWVDGAQNRHQPDMHGPATLRQVGGPASSTAEYGTSFSRTPQQQQQQGGGGGGSYPRSPVSDDHRQTPWGAHGQQPQHSQQAYGSPPYGGSPTQPNAAQQHQPQYQSSFGRVGERSGAPAQQHQQHQQQHNMDGADGAPRSQHGHSQGLEQRTG